MTEIAIIGSASFLLVFSIVNLAAYKQAALIGANRWITLFAFILSFSALLILMVQTYTTNMKAVIVFLVFILLSFSFEYTYGKRVRGHFRKRSYL